jgi:hypothetical protein
MARIIVGSYVVRFPVGGYLSWVLQWLVGLKRLGHDVHFVERASSPGRCFDPLAGTMGDDCAYGTSALNALLSSFGLENCWCFVDANGVSHGLSRTCVDELFRSADLYIDLGLAYGEWQEEAATAGADVYVDGDPGYTQILWEECLATNEPLPEYDYYFSVGRNVGTPVSTVPTAGKQWRGIFHPVNVDLFAVENVDASAPFTTIMTWHSRATSFDGTTYGQKDVEFSKFMHLPGLTAVPLEVAVSGRDVPTDALLAAGWRVRDSVEMTLSFDDFRRYIARSRGEFTVCKNGYVATNSGWFSDRGSAYLASGRPVVMQETGFSAHLPCGRGLFAVRTAEDAAAALKELNSDWSRHAGWAREIAREYLDAPKVIGKFLDEIGI